jgi:hypothetical protein
MNSVICTGRAEEVIRKITWQPSQFCTGGSEEKGQMERSWKGTAIQKGHEDGS